MLTFPAGNREGAGTIVVEIGVFPKELALWQSAINLQFEESQREDCPRPNLAPSSWGGEDTSLMQVDGLVGSCVIHNRAAIYDVNMYVCV